MQLLIPEPGFPHLILKYSINLREKILFSKLS